MHTDLLSENPMLGLGMNDVCVLFLPDRSRDLEAEVGANGPVILSHAPQLKIGAVPNITDASGLIVQQDLNVLSSPLALLCEYDPTKNKSDEVAHFVKNAGIALQLIKPTRYFLEYWMLLDSTGKIKTVSATSRDAYLQMLSRNPTLRYQQANTISPADARKTAGILP
jgi:hypothetical protein